MDNYNELMNVAQHLRTVAVTGDYWMIMQACLNSILKVAESIRGEENGISNTPEP